MNVLCEWCDTVPGRWKHGACLCDPCRDTRDRLDDCEPAGIPRPSEDALKHAERILVKALGPTP